MSSSGDWSLWRISSQSGLSNCVQVRHGVDAVQVRNSREPGGPVLTFTAAEWVAFIAGARLGEFDVPPPP